ncbi:MULTISPECIES: alpha/beta fold hydrolase [Emticicia]|uniref:alpha/beta fold hydrolase n=2 Tax=Leadbetterellaceae TaxID=3141702 RepID=UPI0007D8C356|nr:MULTISPECIES: alpha/beta hydrolase [Emticicia]
MNWVLIHSWLFYVLMKNFQLIIFVLLALQIQAQQSLRRAYQPANVINKIPYGNNVAVGDYVQTQDAKIYYEVYGQGQPIVLLHGGILGSTIEMAEFIDSLKKNFQVIAISTRGHGKSDIGSFPITYEKKANDIIAVINAVTKEKAIILGFSDGAYTAYKVASMYPERIKKMIAIGAGEQIPGLRTINFNHEQLLSDKAYWIQQKALMPQPERLTDFWSAMQTFYNGIVVSKELLGSIKCPVLLLSGELDRNAPLPTVINAYNMLPKAQLSIIPNTGHICFAENFPAVWASITPFLKN